MKSALDKLLMLSGLMMFLSISLQASGKKSDFDLDPICRESDGSFRWEIQNKTSSSQSFQLVPVDNPGTTTSGSSVAAPNGTGAQKDRTVAVTSKPVNAKGSMWELKIAGFSYKKNANTAKTCAPAATKVALCHIPPGNPANAHEISVGHPAYAAHEAHGDVAGPCPGANPCSNPDSYGTCTASGVLH